jgi:protein disulfide-isomerase
VDVPSIWKKVLPLFTSLFLAVAATAADLPYNEKADAKAEIEQALAQEPTTKPVLVVFGANWCGDCRMLDSAMKSGAASSLLAKDFKVVKVDVGRMDKNTDIAATYGLPLAKGIPAVVILSANKKVLYVTREGELANARKMGDTGIYEFFKRVTAPSQIKK